MPVSTQYAVLSRDKKTLSLPDDAQKFVKGGDHFIVVMEHDGLIFKKAYTHRALEEIVTQDDAPLSEQKLNDLIHECR